MPCTPPRHKFRWYDPEDRYLAWMWHDRRTLEHIAFVLGRTVVAVTERVKILQVRKIL